MGGSYSKIGAIVLVAGCMVTGCTTAPYRSAGVGFKESLTKLNAATGDMLKKDLRNRIRQANIHRLGKPLPIDRFLLCGPFGPYAATQGNMGSLQGVADTAGHVASDSPDNLAGLVGTLGASYTVQFPKAPGSSETVSAKKLCEGDVQTVTAGYDAHAVFFDTVGGRNEAASVGGVFTGIQALIAAFEPVISGTLRIWDQHRRVSALEEFFGDDTNHARMNKELEDYQTVLAAKYRYERELAVQAFKKSHEAYRVAQEKKADEKELAKLEGEMLAAASVYDGVLDADVSPHVQKVREAIDNLHRLAKGDYDEKLMALVLADFVNAAKAFIGVAVEYEKLADDPEKRKAIREATKKILGR